MAVSSLNVCSQLSKVVGSGPCGFSTPKNSDDEKENMTDDSSVTIFTRILPAETILGFNNVNPPKISWEKSPWLSKPRKEIVNHSPLFTTPISNRMVKKSNTFATAKDSPSFQKNATQTFDQYNDLLTRINKLKLGLEVVTEINPSVDQWNSVCEALNVTTDDDIVKFGDFVKVVKEFFQVELELKGVTNEKLFSIAARVNLELADESDGQTLKMEMLEKENKRLLTENNTLKTFLEEEKQACCETEKELLRLRQRLQTLINDKRQLQAQLTATCKHGQKENLSNEIKVTDKTVSQATSKTMTQATSKTMTQATDKTKSVERNVRHGSLKKRHKKLAITCRLYQISTDKLLQFTHIVHDILTEQLNSMEEIKSDELDEKEKTDRLLARKPIRVKRASSVQSASGDVANYFVGKYGGGGRLCRAASACTVGPRQKQVTANEKKDVLDRVAKKAKEISDVIETILKENEAANGCWIEESLSSTETPSTRNNPSEKERWV